MQYRWWEHQCYCVVGGLPGCDMRQFQMDKWFAIVFTGWWFGTFFIFPYIGNNHPNWLIFSEGLKPPTRFSISLAWGYNFTWVLAWLSNAMQLDSLFLWCSSGAILENRKRWQDCGHFHWLGCCLTIAIVLFVGSWVGETSAFVASCFGMLPKLPPFLSWKDYGLRISSSSSGVYQHDGAKTLLGWSFSRCHVCVIRPCIETHADLGIPPFFFLHLRSTHSTDSRFQWISKVHRSPHGPPPRFPRLARAFPGVSGDASWRRHRHLVSSWVLLSILILGSTPEIDENTSLDGLVWKYRGKTMERAMASHGKTTEKNTSWFLIMIFSPAMAIDWATPPCMWGPPRQKSTIRNHFPRPGPQGLENHVGKHCSFTWHAWTCFASMIHKGWCIS